MENDIKILDKEIHSIMYNKSNMTKSHKILKSLSQKDYNNLLKLIIDKKVPAHQLYSEFKVFLPENLSKKSYKALIDLEENHDNSWATEIYLRNEKNMDKIAMLYRGNKITYKEMFENSFRYAKSFKSMGIKKGDEIPVLVSNTPEYMYIMIALNLIGATMNTVGSWFHEDYLKEIFAKTKSKYLIVSDDQYEVIKKPFEETASMEKAIMISITDSLLRNKNGDSINPYQEIDNKYHDFSNKVNDYKLTSKKPIIDVNEFLILGKNYDGNVVEDMTLDDIATITYTSGTTKPGYPKGCKHSNRNYISISRFKESDVSKMPAMKDLIVLAHLPSYTQTILTTAYSDSFWLGCTVALEPFGQEEFFLETLKINEPNFVAETTGCFINAAKKLNTDEEWKNVKMPYLMLPTLVGEAASLGEEKYLNYTSRKHCFGTDKIPFPLAPITISFGGGSTENGGILITLFKALQEKKLNYILRKEHMGLQVLPLADVDILDSNGRSCGYDEPGLFVTNSPCNQIGYDKEDFNKGMKIIDQNGKEWYSGGTYAIKCKFGGIRMVGRPKSNIKVTGTYSIPAYKIEDLISKDTKNVLTAIIVKVEELGIEKSVCHIEKYPGSKISDQELLKQCVLRLEKGIDSIVLENLYFRIRTFEESFPLAPSIKKDLVSLSGEGITEKCISYNDIKLNLSLLEIGNQKIKKMRKFLD